jgi:hypothetical protein
MADPLCSLCWFLPCARGVLPLFDHVVFNTEYLTVVDVNHGFVPGADNTLGAKLLLGRVEYS